MRFIALVTVAGMLAGCSSTPFSYRMKNADFWQRADLRAAAYMDEVEAQRLLNRDVARCTVEVKDQERLAAIRNAVPADGRGVDPNSAGGAMAGWDTPQRDGYLLSEHFPFHDFESCMIYRGWERVSTVPHDVAKRSREAWMDHADIKRPKPAAQSKTSEPRSGSNYSYINF